MSKLNHLGIKCMAVATLRQMRQMPHTEIDYFFIQRFYFEKKIYNLNLYSDRNDIH